MVAVKKWWNTSESAWWLKATLVVAVMAAIIMLFVFGVFKVGNIEICANAFACRDMWMDECLATEKYSREECIQLVAGRTLSNDRP